MATVPADTKTAAAPGSNIGTTAVRTTDPSYPARVVANRAARDAALTAVADAVPATVAERASRWSRDTRGYHHEPGGEMLAPHYVARLTIAGRTIVLGNFRTERDARRVSRVARRLLIVGGGAVLTAGFLALVHRTARVKPVTVRDLVRERQEGGA